MLSAYQGLSEHDKDQVLTETSFFLVDLMWKLDEVETERDSKNETFNSIPPYYPRELLQSAPSDLNKNAQYHKPRLLRILTEQEVDLIEDDFRKLLKLRYRKKASLDAGLKLQQAASDFETIWKALDNELLDLFCSVAGYAITLANCNYRRYIFDHFS